jgi:hypothetical protein
MIMGTERYERTCVASTDMSHLKRISQWMIVPTRDTVDAVWGRVVTALAAGVLGSSAKVSGKKIEDRHYPTHVICVYVDPFWDDDEMIRVLRGLREHCGIREELQFKADAVTELKLKDNAHSVPPCFFVSPEGSLTYKPLVPGPHTAPERKICDFFGTARGCKNGATCPFAHEALISGPHTAPERKICNFFGTARGCKNGATCPFAHV